MKRRIFSPMDLSPVERQTILRLAAARKASGRRESPGPKRVGGFYFNPSLRTRISWEQAAQMLGATCQTLNAGADSWAMELDPEAVMDQASVECIVEAAGVLGRMFHVLGVRSFPKGVWEEEKSEPVLNAFGRHADCHLVSLEGSTHHPCQALADHLTLKEKFGDDLAGLPVTLMWAWHPKHLPTAVPNSFAQEALLAGCDLTICQPPGWELDPEIVSAPGRPVRIIHDRDEGLAGAKAVYVKSWGRLDTTGPAPEDLRAWQMDEAAWGLTDQAKVMHCLPTRRNVEIASSILDSDRSVVIDEAENRLWAQAGLLEWLLEESA